MGWSFECNFSWICEIERNDAHECLMLFSLTGSVTLKKQNVQIKKLP